MNWVFATVALGFIHTQVAAFAEDNIWIMGIGWMLLGIWWQLARLEAILRRLARERGVVLFDEGRRQV